jgi:glycosyltransferase involved in cell wall biosynthesis
MTLLAVEAMARQTDWELHFFATESNQRLTSQLHTLAERYPSLTVTPLPNAFHRLQGILNHVQGGKIATVAGNFAALAPDIALIIQGDIEISSTGLLAARKAGIPAVSYIPLPHNQVEKGGKLGAIRDLFARHLYAVPDGFITISTVLGEMLQSKGTTAPIKVVYNGIATDQFHPIGRGTARDTLKLPQDPVIIGIAGRLERKQKQQQLLLDGIADQSPPLSTAHAVFCGDGQDREFLQQRAAGLGIVDRTHFLEWRNDLATFYSALDVLAIPSRYEGVPLVMLEALCCGTPVVAGNRDGMKELLPSEWLFEPGDVAGFRNAITAIVAHPDATRAQVAELQTRIRRSMTVEAFGNSFTRAVTEFLQQLRPLQN